MDTKTSKKKGLMFGFFFPFILALNILFSTDETTQFAPLGN
jgi:hypothetical protein